MLILEISQITAPAGIANITARPKIMSVRSINDVYNVCKMLGVRYGGSSSTKKEASPLRSVRDNNHEEKKVKRIPSNTTPTTASIDTVELMAGGTKTPRKIVAMIIKVGHRPLQTEKLLVMMAINFSRGLLMMRVATTPAALHPKPIVMVSACLPWAPDFFKTWSRLNATRGKYPKSSSSVNNGKKMAIGGSMTDTTHAVAR